MTSSVKKQVWNSPVKATRAESFIHELRRILLGPPILGLEALGRELR